MDKKKKYDLGLTDDVYEINDDGTATLIEESSLTKSLRRAKEEADEKNQDKNKNITSEKIQKQILPSKKRRFINIFMPFASAIVAAGATAGIVMGVQSCSKNIEPFEERMLKKFSVATCNEITKITLNNETNDEEEYANLQYSKDGNSWEKFETGTEVTFQKGETIYLKGNNPKGFSYIKEDGTVVKNQINISEGSISLAGNIMGLIYDGYETKNVLPGAACFHSLFKDSVGIKSIDKLKFPNCKATTKCYASMFRGCTGITSIPSNLLPSTDLSDSEYCYTRMFEGCTGLTNIENFVLPATTLGDFCYQNMFLNCSEITKINQNMLPATTLTKACYSYMFEGCKKLNKITNLPADLFAHACYLGMFEFCETLIEAKFDAKELQESSCQRMFMGCTNLKKVEVNFADWGTTNSTESWLEGVGTTGTFICPNDLIEKTGKHNIPEGWIIVRK